jgi:hypothetical protein
VIEDQVISEFPDVPRGTYEHLEEAWTVKHCLSQHIILFELHVGVPMNIKESPALPCKYTVEKKVLDCFQSIIET